MSVITTVGLTLTLSDSLGSTALVKSVAGLLFTGTLNQYLQAQNIGVAAPTNLTTAAQTTGGSLAANTYYWKVTGLNGTGETTGSNEVTVTTTGSTSSVALAWTAMAGATSYRIYRGTSPGGESIYYTSTTNTFTDTGASGTSASVPGSNTTGTTFTPTLSQTPLQVVYLRNLSSTNTVTVAWTPTSGSAATIAVLAPQGVILFCEPAAVSGGGITALTLTASAPGTPIEGLWGA